MAQSDDIFDGLEERLQNHAKAFDSLLALTPAREYFGSQIDDGLDPSEQWNRKKQTKEQKRAAKKAKLDPANQKSALDIMKERENKRKRELGLIEEEEGEAEDGVAKRQAAAPPATKRQKQELSAEADEAERAAKAAKRREARDRKKEKVATKKAKADAKKARKLGTTVATDGDDEDLEQNDTIETVEKEDVDDGELGDLDISGLADPEDVAGDDVQNDDDNDDDASSAPSTPAALSPTFDVATNHSEASSSSSIVPPTTTSVAKTARRQAQKPLPEFKSDTTAAPRPAKSTVVDGTESPRLRLPDIDQAELQERLRKRIEELRSNRKADGPDGKPARSRQELLDQRRKKEEQRKAHKKELRRQAKEEEAKQREEQLRGSGSPMSLEPFGARPSPKPQQDPSNNFSFSRVAFADGTAADASFTGLADAPRRKGPSDARTALLAAEKKQARLAGLDAGKRADIAEKDMWLNAKKHAHGERVRDDTSLLKKALKRKDKLKGKSEKAWQERGEAVVKGREMKQKRREANLQKRRDDKGGSKGGKKKPSSSGGGAKSGGKKKARPGFEGRFKA